MYLLQMNIIGVCRLIMELCNIGLVFFSYRNNFLCFFFSTMGQFVHCIKCALLYMFYELCSKGKLIYRLVQKFLDTECLTHCL